MSTRLQVRLDERELRELRSIARKNGMTVAGWVRRALRVAARYELSGDAERKIEAIRAAARNEFPTADIEQMLTESARGCVGGPV